MAWLGKGCTPGMSWSAFSSFSRSARSSAAWRPPYNVGALNAEAALFALEHADEYARQAALLRSERERLQAALKAIAGVQPFPSDANMILVRVPDSAHTFAGMKTRGVLVKNVAALHPLLANCLRLTVGTPQENEHMIQALKASL